MKKIDYLTISPSALATFYTCSQRYLWQFIEEKKPDEGEIAIWTVFGVSFHKAMELHFKYLIPLEEIKNAWKSLFIAISTEQKGFTFSDKSKFEDYLERGYTQISNIEKMKKRWEKYKIVDVERYIKIPYENKFFNNVFLSGRLDLLLGDLKTFIVLDWKTSKTKEKIIEENVQMTFYIHFLKKMFPEIDFESFFGALAYPMDGEIIFTQREEKEFGNFFTKIDMMLERISKEDFHKEPKLQMRLNDCHFCTYKKTCNKC